MFKISNFVHKKLVNRGWAVWAAKSLLDTLKRSFQFMLWKSPNQYLGSIYWIKFLNRNRYQSIFRTIFENWFFVLYLFLVGRKTGTQFQVLSQNIMSHGCTIELVYALKKKSRNSDKIFFSCLCARVHTHFSTPRVTWEIAPFFSQVNQDMEFQG